MLEYIVFVLDAFIALLGLVSSVGWRLDTPKPSSHCVPAPDEHPVWVTEFCRTSTNKPNSQEDQKRPKSFSASVSRKDGGSGGAGGGLLFSLGSRPQPGGPAVLLLRIRVSFLVPGLWFSFCSAQVHHLGPGPPVVWESTLRLSLGSTLSSPHCTW